MANLLEDGTLWESRPAGNSPPEYWTGVAYEILRVGGGFPEDSAGIVLVDPAPADSTIFATVTPNLLEHVGTANYYLVVDINGALQVFLMTEDVSFDLDMVVPTGATVSIYISDFDNGFPTTRYSYEVFLNPAQPPSLRPFYVYELDKGWTFDGAYIPHFLELNWYFGETPTMYHGIQKVRVHGLSKGLSTLTLSVNGMQTSYEEQYTEPQWLDLPRNAEVISVDLLPKTNYTDVACRGLSIQMKFEGRNTDIALPEPQHALQVLIVQSTPVGTGFDAN